MERDEGGLSLEQVLRAVLARRKTFGASLVASSIVLGAGAAAIPPSYKATVVMTIDPGRYPNDFLRPNVIPGLELRLGGMERMLESAPVIEELRGRTGLAKKEPPGSGGVLEALGLASDPIDAWRKAFKFEIPIDVVQSPNHSPDEAPLVEMSFKSSDPEMAARVVNECAKRANEENNRFRRAFVEEVVRFIQKAQERATETARQREEAFNAFKLANADRLPEQEAFLEAKLAQLRIRYADLKNSERFSEARLEQLTSERGLLVAQIALSVQLMQATGGDERDTSTPSDLKHDRLRLQMVLDEREDALMQLLAAYTDKDPRVRGLEELVEKSRSRIAEIDAKLRQLAALTGDAAPLTSVAPLTSAGVSRDFMPSREHKLFPNDPYETPGQRFPNAPLNHRLEAADAAPVPSSSTAASSPAPAPPGHTSKVVDVLAGENVDERTLQRMLDESSYRLVVANPGYGRIRQIDSAAKETRDGLKEVVRQREEAFTDIRKSEDELAAIPEVRQRLESLARDLIESREDYRRLSDQLDNARKALEVENEGKGEQFRVIDFARPPTKPSGPGRPIFIAIALVLAFAVAAGVCLVLDMRARGFFQQLATDSAPPSVQTAKKEGNAT